MRLFWVLVFLPLFLHFWPHFRSRDSAAQICPKPTEIGFRVQKVIRRSAPGFTEGLVFSGGFLYESSGIYGQSAIRRIDPETGEVRELARLDSSEFAEGLDLRNGQLLQLTWKEHVALFWNLMSEIPSAVLDHRLSYPWEGWGLTHSATSWIASDGSDTLHFLDTGSAILKERKRVRVRVEQAGRDKLNELEYVNGRILANVYQTDQIVRINPDTGCVDGIAEMSGLRDYLSMEERKELEQDAGAVLNGIAFDSIARVIYVTGKNWPLIFRMQISA